MGFPHVSISNQDYTSMLVFVVCYPESYAHAYLHYTIHLSQPWHFNECNLILRTEIGDFENRVQREYLNVRGQR